MHVRPENVLMLLIKLNITGDKTTHEHATYKE